MAEVGKCLLFYLKYRTEMNRLYWTDEPNTDGLPDADKLLPKITMVGDAACSEAAELLDCCAIQIEQQLQPVSRIARVNNNVKHSWGIRFRIAPRKGNPKESGVEVGVYISDQTAALIPWVWCRGGRRAEDDIVHVVNCGIRAAAGTHAMYPGTVALREIKIPIPNRLDDCVKRDPLVTEVETAFSAISPRTLSALVTVAKQRSKS